MVAAMQKIKPYVYSLGLVILMSLFGEGLHRHLAPTNLVMLYLLAVSVSASLWGRGPATATAFVSVLVFDFLFVPPQYSFTVEQTEYLLTFIGLLGVGLLISEFASRLQKNALAAQTLRASEKLHTALLNSISHDLRTPLVAITGSLSSLATNSDAYTAAEKKELIRLAYEKSVLLNTFVGELLDMSRIEAGSLRLNLHPCDIREIISIAVGRVKDKIGHRTIERKISQHVDEIEVDIVLMAKVITNLLDNAVKFSANDSSIVITASHCNGLIRISVADQGMGIPPNELPHVFDKFYQVTRAQKLPGTGLGLAICKGLVEAHGGKIWLESQPGQGTRAFIELRQKPEETAP
jgi:two-component system, OmpR family, sensor histidine kinase KdpD